MVATNRHGCGKPGCGERIALCYFHKWMFQWMGWDRLIYFQFSVNARNRTVAFIAFGFAVVRAYRLSPVPVSEVGRRRVATYGYRLCDGIKMDNFIPDPDAIVDVD